MLPLTTDEQKDSLPVGTKVIRLFTASDGEVKRVEFTTAQGDDGVIELVAPNGYSIDTLDAHKRSYTWGYIP